MTPYGLEKKRTKLVRAISLALSELLEDYKELDDNLKSLTNRISPEDVTRGTTALWKSRICVRVLGGSLHLEDLLGETSECTNDLQGGIDKFMNACRELKEFDKECNTEYATYEGTRESFPEDTN